MRMAAILVVMVILVMVGVMTVVGMQGAAAQALDTENEDYQPGKPGQDCLGSRAEAVTPGKLCYYRQNQDTARVGQSYHTCQNQRVRPLVAASHEVGRGQCLGVAGSERVYAAVNKRHCQDNPET